MPELNYYSVLNLFVTAMFIWAGISILIAVKRLNDSYELVPNRFIYPANCKPARCKDPAGFIGFISPRLNLFAIAALVISILRILALFGLFSFLPGWISQFGFTLLFIALFVSYVVFINQAAKRFW